jgi:glycosyltransferase involved in cell wall biosynthesis
MSKFSKILMLVNWGVHKVNGSNNTFQSPNVIKEGEKYWFFKDWPDSNAQVEVMDFCKLPLLHHIERFWLKFYVVQAIKALFVMRKYDLIISHGAQSGVLLAFIRSLLNIKSPPHIIIDVGCFNGGRNKRRELLSLRLAVRSIQGVISHCNQQKEYYEKCLPQLKDKNRFVPFGTDPDFFKPLKTEIQGEPSDGDADNYIVCVGYLKRDWPTLIQAFDHLRCEIKLKLVGARSAIGFEFPNKLCTRIECLPYVKIQELKKILAGARFMVLPLPYYRYSFGQMTLLQAMSMGKAVIVTEVPGIKDYVQDGYNALLVKPYAWKDLKDKMELLLRDEKLGMRLGENARRSILEKYNEKKLAKGIYQAVEELCGGTIEDSVGP